MSDSSLIGSVFVDLDKLKSKMDELGNVDIVLTINSQEIQNSIKGIKKELNTLASSPYDIKLTIDTEDNAKKSIKNVIEELSKATNDIGKNVSEALKAFSSSGGFSFQNVFNYSNSSKNKGLSLYKDQARELIGVLNQLQNAMQQIDSKSLAKTYVPLKSMFAELDNMNLHDLTNKIGSGKTTDGIKSIITELERYKFVMEEILQKNEVKLTPDIIDTSKLESATKKVVELENKDKQIEQTFIDAAKQSTQATEEISKAGESIKEIKTTSIDMGESLEESSNKIKTVTEEIGQAFDVLKERINNAFNFEQSITNIQKLKEQIDSFGSSLVSTIENYQKISNYTSGNNTASNTTSTYTQGAGNINTELPHLGSKTSVLVNGEHVQEIHKYNEELGVTKTLIQDIKDGDVTKTTTKITENFEAQAKAAKKAAELEKKWADERNTYISDQTTKTLDLESKAFKQNNPLTGSFKEQADEAIGYWKSKIDELRSYTGKLTADQKNAITEAEATAKRIVLEQQKAQWRGDKLAAKDVPTKVANANWGLDIQVEELKQAGKYTEDAQQKIKQLKESLSQVKDQNAFSEWSKQLNQFNQELELTSKKEETLFKSESLNLKVEKLVDRLENLKNKYQEFVNANPGKANSEIEQRFEKIHEIISGIDLKNIDPNIVKLLTQEVGNLGTKISGVVTPAQSLSQVLQQNFGGLGQYLARFTSSLYIITKSISTIKSMISEVKSLDTALVELQKVTNLTGDSLAQFTDKAYEMGKSVGRTGKDVIEAVTTFSRAGYDLNESTQLAQSALVMTNVGVDINSTADAASDMISILKAFNKQADESMEVIDKLYNVANKEPLDFGNITQMLVTAGGTLSQTGTSLEETMGLVTGAFATLRDTSVANG